MNSFDGFHPGEPPRSYWEGSPVDQVAEFIWSQPEDLTEVLAEQGIELPYSVVDALVRFAANNGTGNAEAFAKAFVKAMETIVTTEAARRLRVGDL